MRFSGIVMLAVVTAVVGCNNPQQAPTKEMVKEAPKVAAKPSSSLDEKGTVNLMSLLTSYYELKDALVATDPSKADIAASHVLSAAETMRHELGDTNPEVRATLDTVMRQSEGIVNLKDETCNKKRAIFEQVSDNIFAIAKQSGLKNGGVYQQHCPMAFDDKGASWLSNSEEIRNPYLPQKMLHCGEVQDSL